MTRSELTAWLNDNEDDLVNEQEAGLIADGKYRQALRGNRKPPHRARAVGVPLAADVEVDEYDGPRGKGWAVALHADEAGTLWYRVKDYGADGRTHAWRREV